MTQPAETPSTDASSPVPTRRAGATLVRGATSFLSFHVLGVAILFGVQLLLVRLLGREQYGNYIYPLTCINLLVMAAKMGLDTASLRLLSTYHSRNDWSPFRGFIRRSQQLALAASILLAVGTVVVVACLQDRVDPDLAWAFAIASLMVPLKVLIELRLNCFRALKRMAWSKAPQAVILPLLFVAGMLAINFVVDGKPTAWMAMAVHSAAALATLALTTAVWFVVQPRDVRHATAEYRTREWMGISLPLALTSSFNWIIRQSDIVMIGGLVGADKAAVYAVASRCVKLCGTGLTAVNAIAAPIIAELSAKNEIQELQRMATTSTRAIYALSLPMCAAMILWGREVLGLFGESFVEGYPALVVLTAGQLLHSLAGTTGFLMTMTGHQRLAARILGRSAILNVALNAILIPQWGLIGGAFATMTTTLIWTICLFYQMKKRVGISIGIGLNDLPRRWRRSPPRMSQTGSP